MTLAEDKAKKTALILKINNLIDKHRRENRRKVVGSEETVEAGVKLDCGCDTCLKIERLGRALNALRTREEEDRIVHKRYDYTVIRKGKHKGFYKTIKALSIANNLEEGTVDSKFRRCTNNRVVIGDFEIKRKLRGKTYNAKKKQKKSDLLRSSILEKEAEL